MTSQQHIQKLQGLIASKAYTEAFNLANTLLDNQYDENVLTLVVGMYYQQQNYTKVIELLDKMLLNNPYSAVAYNNKGVVHDLLGEREKSKQCFIKAIELSSDYLDPLINLSRIFYQEKKWNDALRIYEKIISLGKCDNNLLGQYADILFELALYEKAIEVYLHVLKVQPKDVALIFKLALSYEKLKNYRSSLSYYQQIVSIQPDSVLGYIGISSAFFKMENYQEALLNAKRALYIDANNVAAKNNLAVIYHDMGDTYKAIEVLESIRQKKNENIEVLNNLSGMYVSIGQTQKAIELCKEIITREPGFSSAYLKLSALTKLSLEDNLVSGIYRHLKNRQLNEFDQANFHYALFNILHKHELYDKSFFHLKKAKQIRKKSLQYSFADDVRLFSIIKQVFDYIYNNIQLPTSDDKSKKIIFVVGMPRSGTSLVEKILDSHPLVYGGGELDQINYLMMDLFNNFCSASSEKKRKQQLLSDLLEIREKYYETITLLDKSSFIFVDKMPLNFRFIGFLLLLFTDCRIINLSREPVSVCWSNYKNMFSGGGNKFSFDPVDIAQYFLLYQDIMVYWKNYFPNKIFGLKYEDLIEETEENIKTLLEFCDLPWNDSCLFFYQNTRSTRTASASQVKKPIYKGSNNAWKNYAKYLQEMIRILEAGLSPPKEYLFKIQNKKAMIKPSLPQDFEL